MDLDEHPVLRHRIKLGLDKRWPLTDNDVFFLALAMAGEVGEVANLVKKEWRGSLHLDAAVAHEIADVYVYLLLLAKARGIEDLDALAIEKLNIVAGR